MCEHNTVSAAAEAKAKGQWICILHMFLRSCLPVIVEASILKIHSLLTGISPFTYYGVRT